MSGNSERTIVENSSIVVVCPNCDEEQEVQISRMDKSLRKTIIRCIKCDNWFTEFLIMTNWRDRKTGKMSTVPEWEVSK